MSESVFLLAVFLPIAVIAYGVLFWAMWKENNS